MHAHLAPITNRIVLLSVIALAASAAVAEETRDRCFDEGWRFHRADVPGAEAPEFDDTSWRSLDLPHDWSIEDLPASEEGTPAIAAVTGRWRFHKGDDPAWKDPTADDSQWQEVTLPDNWEHHSGYTDNNVFGWYRRHLDVPVALKGKSIDLLLGQIDDVDETYLNGVRIGGTGSLPPAYATAWEQKRRYPVPAGLLRGDGRDLLAVRVYDGQGNGGIYGADPPAVRVGPFAPGESPGGESTGHVLGGTGWYRKHFSIDRADREKTVSVRFDGIYRDADVWINGQHVGNHPYGYTPFVVDLTPHLKPAGESNVLVVRVRNLGQNSRWYSGSGIYRHAWLTVTDPVHVAQWGISVTTSQVSDQEATVSVATALENARDRDATVSVRIHLVSPDGQTVGTADAPAKVEAGRHVEVRQTFRLESPKLWSLEAPQLYRAEVEIGSETRVLDRAATTFGIRAVHFDALTGLTLNGRSIKLKGGCLHHDNGPLGAAAIDRAEERRVETMKANGFNAIRTSHNPPSPAFLDACDRLGVLVIDEAFDMWEQSKKPDDYSHFFREWWERDVSAMVLRDRNHPSIILWSIGNEIPERAEDTGVQIGRRLADTVRRLDPSRPVTAAVCEFWDHAGRKWADSARAFSVLDVGGYNYQWRQYAPDHRDFPQRVMVGTESFPMEAFENWQAVLKCPWVIGDFVWTGMDYLGESGIGHAVLDNEKADFLRPWPWFNAYCGDIDICGFKKPQSYYRDVVWGRSQLEMAVHVPVPSGRSEKVSKWGWPAELRSWTWLGQEGQPMQVAVYTSCERVRLELNGKLIGEQPVSPDTKLTARFEVPYAPGELRATGLIRGEVAATANLRTAGPPRRVRLTADRTEISANRNDLAYVKVEITDEAGELVPDAAIPVHFTVRGAGELAAVGSANPSDAASFRAPVRNTFQGRCLAILRPTGKPGTITLDAVADGLIASTVTVSLH